MCLLFPDFFLLPWSHWSPCYNLSDRIPVNLRVFLSLRPFYDLLYYRGLKDINYFWYISFLELFWVGPLCVSFSIVAYSISWKTFGHYFFFNFFVYPVFLYNIYPLQHSYWRLESCLCCLRSSFPCRMSRISF